VRAVLKEAWTIAIETLSWIEMRRLSEPVALTRTVKQLNITDSNAIKLAHLLVSETVRHRNFINRFIEKVVPPNSLDSFTLGVQAFLKLYVYQTRIAKNWSKTDLTEAQNISGLARSILGWKTLQAVEPFLGVLLTTEPTLVFEVTSDEERVGLRTFHPTWFVKYCFNLLGRRETIEMLEANAKQPSTYVTLNMLKGGENEVLEKLEEDGIEVEKVKGLRYLYKVTASKQPITRTTSYRNSLVYPQDKGSCLAVQSGNPTQGLTVLDVCAAPGAQTAYLAQLMHNTGMIVSVDYSKRRMSVWKKEMLKTDSGIAVPVIADALNPLPFNMKADVLVLDPPCTGTGTLGREPSARWRLGARSVDKMAEIQWEMLNNCSGYVKVGGNLVYHTCSITVEENEMLIERFLKWHLEFFLSDTSPKIGSPGLRGLEKCRRLYPHTHDCDGSFIAKMVKGEA
jgi:16S rRNA (cytosine967-C5)-methyltransferase